MHPYPRGVDTSKKMIGFAMIQEYDAPYQENVTFENSVFWAGQFAWRRE